MVKHQTGPRKRQRRSSAVQARTGGATVLPDDVSIDDNKQTMRRRRRSIGSSTSNSEEESKVKNNHKIDYVSQKVAKYFDGVLFEGRIVSSSCVVGKQQKQQQLWHVEYNDGDSEDFELSEVQEGINLFQKSSQVNIKPPRNKYKRKSVSAQISSSARAKDLATIESNSSISTSKKKSNEDEHMEKNNESEKSSKSKKKINSSTTSRAKVVTPDISDGAYAVEYAPTGRSACKRCFEKIMKGDLRIAHRPLFRGKPGFTIYRHLSCVVFPEEITQIGEVRGIQNLKDDDVAIVAARIETSAEERRKEDEDMDPDELVATNFSGEMRCSPVGLTASLLPFQIEGSSWMYSQELNNDVRGGILADEMGMGKTIQTITAMLDNKPKLQHSESVVSTNTSKDFPKEEEKWSFGKAEWLKEMEMCNVPKKVVPKTGPLRAGTLVVCPVIALTQWKNEIEKFSANGTLSVAIYHGPKRSVEWPRDMLAKYDVVLTTYQVLEADFRKMISPNKVTCPNCGGKFKLDKLHIHLKYFCGEHAERTEAQMRQRRGANNRSARTSSSARDSKDEKKKSFRSSKELKARSSMKILPSDDSESEDNLETESVVVPKTKLSPRNVNESKRRKVEIVPSESELPEVGDYSESVTRMSRKAAVNASKKLKSSSPSWTADISGEDDGEDEYRYSSSESSESEDDSCEQAPLTRKSPVQKVKKSEVKSNDSTCSADSDKEAISKQREVLEMAASKGKKRDLRKAPKKKGKKAKENGEVENLDLDELIKESAVGCKMSVLHSLCFWRVVLDEAHMIKSRSSQTSAAAFALTAIHRWCLSGTPLQNRVGEFYSLVRFLRLDPMALYFCKAKGCSCKSLHYRFVNQKCLDCGHGSINHFSHFNKFVLNPFKRDGYRGDGRRAMMTLKNEVLDKCLMRRTKETKADDMKLPPRFVSIRKVRLHPVEEDFYTTLYTKTRTSFNDYVDSGTLLNNYAHIFDLLIRMRQAVNHPYLVLYNKDKQESQGDSAISRIHGDTTCGICHEEMTQYIVADCCSRGFCKECVSDYMDTAAGISGANQIPCPSSSCREPFSIDLKAVQVTEEGLTNVDSSHLDMPSLKDLPHVATGSILRQLSLVDFATSSKIEALVEELYKMRAKSPGSKAIVFSQFVNMLDLIRWRLHSDPCLQNLGLGVKALHGGMNVKVRDQNLDAFKNDNSVRVLLVSLKAGGVALNLTVANYIFLMDPWWNPAAEFQAIDRTHRLGQYRAIRAVRFIAENTVEERILQLQEKKRLVFDGTVGRDAGSLAMLTVEDMKNLFS